MLSIPSEAAKVHSQQLQTHLRQVIQLHDGKISFHDYMNIVLYAPGLGYYSAGAHKLGAGGDFVTAPEISPLFGITLVKSLMPIVDALSNPYWLELGAGTGKLAESILGDLAEQKKLPQKYFILEISADLKMRQQQYLRKKLSEEIFHRIVWLEKLPTSFRGIILANEVLDALPIHRFKITKEGEKEIYVEMASNHNTTFKEIFDTPHSIYLQQRIAALNLPIDYESEINLQQEALIKSLNDIFIEGTMLFIDYGYPAKEYYHPDRNKGTLMCHYQHRAHMDPYFWPGLQDITAHVDFTALAKCGIENGLSLMAFTTQEAWLLNHGILELAEQLHHHDKQYYANKLTQNLRKLISPAEMGELFKFILFGKKLLIDLPNLQKIDRRHCL